MRAFFLLFLFVAGCVYGPEVKHKSSLNVLNGDNYDTGPLGANQIVVPILKRKARKTSLSGQLILDKGFASVPLSNIPVKLLDQKGNSLAQTQSGSDGKFSFHEDIEDGKYFLNVSKGQLKGQQSVVIKGYFLEGVKFLIQDTAE